MRNLANVVVCGAIVFAVVSSLFAKDYETVSLNGIEVEYESTIEESKARQVADVISAPGVLGSIDDLRVILDVENGKYRFWMATKPGYFDDEAYVNAMTSVASIVAATCFDKDRFEVILCTRDRTPKRTIAPTPGFDKVVQEKGDILFYNGMPEDEAKVFMEKLREVGFFAGNGAIAQIGKNGEQFDLQIVNSKKSLDTYTEANIELNLGICHQKVVDGAALRVRYSVGPNKFLEKMTRSRPSIGIADQDMERDGLLVQFGEPITEPLIEKIFQRLSKTAIATGVLRITQKDKVVDVRAVTISDVDVEKAYQYSNFIAREVKTQLPVDCVVNSIACDDTWGTRKAGTVESGNGEIYEIGDDRLFASGDLTEKEINNYIDALTKWNIYGSSNSNYTWLNKTGDEISMCCFVTASNAQKPETAEFLMEIGEDLDQNVFTENTFRLSISGMDGIATRQVYPAAE